MSSKCVTTDKIDQEVEKQSRVEAELAELESLELGLDDDLILDAEVKRRFDMAVQAHFLGENRDNLKSSVDANNNVGNESAAKKFEERLKEVVAEYHHQLRAIKSLDEKYPQAKRLMQEKTKKERATLKK